MLDNVVYMIMKSKKANNEADEYSRYKDRLNNYKEWLNKKSLKDVKAGD